MGAHVRNKLLAGGLAAGPIAIVVWAAIWLEQQTKPVAQFLRLEFHFPGLGILILIVGLYLLGLLVTSLIGTWLLAILDRILQRVPGLNYLYKAWKDILVQPPGKAGIYNRVVLIPALRGQGMQLAFTSGEVLPTDPQSWCVYVPGVPNPLTGQLLVLRREACQELAIPTEEAFKFLLSSGNYLPSSLQPARQPVGDPLPPGSSGSDASQVN